MNFDEIRKKMEEEASNQELPLLIDLNKGKNNPVERIRFNMKREIVIQILAILVFFTFPFIRDMYAFPRSTYLIFMFLITLMTMGYLIKMIFFVKNTADFAVNTREALSQFIFETKLTLEVVKSFGISGSLLLPIAFFALYNGSINLGDNALFTKWFTLDISQAELLLLVLAYLGLAIFFYYIFLWQMNFQYGKYLKQLERLKEELAEEYV